MSTNTLSHGHHLLLGGGGRRGGGGEFEALS